MFCKAGFWSLGNLDWILKNHFQKILFLLIGIIFWSFQGKGLRWVQEDLTDKSTLVQVMAWCHQAISPYLSQCWLKFMESLGHNVLLYLSCLCKTWLTLAVIGAWYCEASLTPVDYTFPYKSRRTPSSSKPHHFRFVQTTVFGKFSFCSFSWVRSGIKTEA